MAWSFGWDLRPALEIPDLGQSLDLVSQRGPNFEGG